MLWKHIPIPYACHKETYENAKTALKLLKFEQFSWKITEHFQMIAFLLGLQGGFIKNLVIFVFRIVETHNSILKKYAQSKWSLVLDNVKRSLLIELEKVLMPPFHLKLGLFIQFRKVLKKDSASLKFLQVLFPKFCELR